MRNRLASSLCLTLLLTGLSACPTDGDSTEVGLAELTIATTPADVQCLSLTATGSTTVVRNFDVVPSQPATLSAPGLPTGTVTLSEMAYNVPCSQVTAATVPTWISDSPVVVQLSPDQAVSVALVLRRPGKAVVSNTFDDGLDGGVRDGGNRDGINDGPRDGINDGPPDGINDGRRDGINDGPPDGINDGRRDGINDGPRD